MFTEASPMFLLCIISSLCVVSHGLSFSKIVNGSIITSVKKTNWRGINFDKRTVDYSVPTTVTFTISVDQVGQDVAYTWFLNGAALKVNRYISLPENPGDIFTTEVVDGSTINVTLHLQNKGLVSGNYTLVVTQGSATAQAHGFVHAEPVLPLFPKDRRVLEGDRLNLLCEVDGYPKPSKVIWKFSSIKADLMDDVGTLEEALAQLQPLDPNSTHYTLNTITVSEDQLVFKELPRSLNGLYECSVTSDRTLILVNVKDRWAALWPFIGIVIEVGVLVTVILLYERHQMRSKPSKPEAPTGPAETSSPNTKQRASITQHQQNNMTVPVNPGDPVQDVMPDANKVTAIDGGGSKQDELRVRAVARC